jgi:nicotinamidase-related amidase
VENKDEYLGRLEAAVSAAHESRIQVIYVVVGFRPGFPEVSARNKMFGGIKEAAASTLLNPRPVLDPAEDDIVVTKRRVSAFSGSDLEVILRAENIQRLVLTGIATSGVVLSTVREASDKDFQLTVLSDLCADSDAGVHAMLLERIFPRQAEVMTSEEWIRLERQ